MYWFKESLLDPLKCLQIFVVFLCIFIRAPIYLIFFVATTQMLSFLCCLPWRRKEARKWKEIEGSYDLYIPSLFHITPSNNPQQKRPKTSISYLHGKPQIILS